MVKARNTEITAQEVRLRQAYSMSEASVVYMLVKDHTSSDVISVVHESKRVF